MVEGQQEAIRRNLVAQAALVWGQVTDLDRFIATGEVEVRPAEYGQPAPVTPEVARYKRAIEIAGRFVMPDEVDKWLALDDRLDELPAEPTQG